MALQLATDTIYNFIKLTGFDVQTYVLEYGRFLNDDYPDIVDYYNGGREDLDQNAIKALDNLLRDSRKLEDVMINITEFDRLDDWNLVYYVDEIRAKLKVINNISRFLRSAKYEGFNESSLNTFHTFEDHQTPEMVAEIESEDADNAWVDVLRKNYVLETDYQEGVGGWTIMLGRKSLTNFSLRAVVDNLQGESVYGKDMDVLFDYVDDDVKVLTPKQTVSQSVLILANLRQGDIPEFRGMGIGEQLIIGGNIGAINIPFIVRQMTETFSTDDTLVQMSVTKIDRVDTNLYIEFNVNTFFNLVEQTSVTI